MIEWLAEPFSSALATRGLAELVLLGLACGPLGVWVVLHRHAYAAESIAHGMLPGLVLAALAGIPLGLGGAAGLLGAAAAIALARRYGGVGPDGAVAVTVTALFGLGGLLALSPAAPLRLGEILFGDPLGVSDGDLLASAALVAAIGVGLAALRRPLGLSAFDPRIAGSLGASPARAELALLVLLAATVLVAVSALGNLLVVALIVAPAAAALRLSRRLDVALRLSAALAVLAGVIGIYASYQLEIAAGAAVALAAVALYALSATFSAFPARRSPPPLGSARGAARRTRQARSA